MTVLVPLVVLGAVSCVAIAAAWVATLRARAARAALRAAGEEHRVELTRHMETAGRLADDAAHDLNDLLTAITGHAELLIASLNPSSKSLQDAHEIRRAALSAARFTKPLRILSSGHRTPADVIDVNAVVTRAANALQQMLGPTIAVTLALGDDIKRVKIAAHHLEEIVLNLGIHARHAMPRDGCLTVATAMHAHGQRDAASGTPSEYVRLVVTDTSGGVSAEDARGHAIGLARVDVIVKQAGGRIQVGSTAGLGTTFTIDLPATSEPAALSDVTRANTRQTALVLVVEDEPGMRELIRLVLVRAGHEVVTVAGPRAALAALHQQPAIALMLVDVVMPEMDGYELAVEARKLSPGVHIVFVSAFAPDPARQPSCDGFVTKPFTGESLTGIVAHALSA